MSDDESIVFTLQLNCVVVGVCIAAFLTIEYFRAKTSNGLTQTLVCCLIFSNVLGFCAAFSLSSQNNQIVCLSARHNFGKSGGWSPFRIFAVAAEAPRSRIVASRVVFEAADVYDDGFGSCSCRSDQCPRWRWPIWFPVLSWFDFVAALSATTILNLANAQDLNVHLLWAHAFVGILVGFLLLDVAFATLKDVFHVRNHFAPSLTNAIVSSIPTKSMSTEDVISYLSLVCFRFHEVT